MQIRNTLTDSEIVMGIILFSGFFLDYFSTVLFIHLPYIVESNPIVQVLLEYNLFFIFKLGIVLFILGLYYYAVCNPEKFSETDYQVLLSLGYIVGACWLFVGVQNLFLVF